MYDEIPTSFPNTEIMRVVLKFAERHYEEALATLDAIPDAVMARELGERAAGLRAMFECDSYDRLGDPQVVQQACGRSRHDRLAARHRRARGGARGDAGGGPRAACPGSTGEELASGRRRAYLIRAAPDLTDDRRCPYWIG